MDTASDVVKGAMSGIDALILTDEEEIRYGMQKTELKLKVADSLASHIKDTLSESTERSQARRWIAKSIVKVKPHISVTDAQRAFDEVNSLLALGGN